MGHLSLRLSNTSLTFDKELNTSFQEHDCFSGRCPLAYQFHFKVIFLWDLSYSLFSFQLTHPPVKNLTLPHRKMPVFQSVTPWRISFTLSCVISLWDSAPAHSPSGKELNSSSQEYARVSVSSSRHNVFILPCVESLAHHICSPYYSLIFYSLIY